MILVAIILFLFLGNMRGAIIVSLTIPFALMFAAICLDLSHIPGEPAFAGRAGFRHARGWLRGDDRKHRPPSCAKRRPASRIREDSAMRRTRCSGRCSLRAPSSSLRTCRSSRCKRWRGGCSSRWRGRSRFALLGALVFSIVVAPVMASILFSKGAKEWQNPLDGLAHRTLSRRRCGPPLSTATARSEFPWRCSPFAIYLSVGGPIGSEFLPHLDEGSIWVRGTLPPSEGPTASIDFTNKARLVMASFPEVTQVVSQTGRPDDGTDTTGFFDTEYFVDLKPKEQWRPIFHQDKEKLIACHGPGVVKIPGRNLELLATDLGQHGRGSLRREGRVGGKALWRRSAHAGTRCRVRFERRWPPWRESRTWASFALSANRI